MCIVSAIHDYSQRWVPPLNPPVAPSPIGTFSFSPPVMDTEALRLLKKILALCEKLDAKMGEPECIDPNKAKVLEALEAYVASQKGS